MHAFSSQAMCKKNLSLIHRSSFPDFLCSKKKEKIVAKHQLPILLTSTTVWSFSSRNTYFSSSCCCQSHRVCRHQRNRHGKREARIYRQMGEEFRHHRERIWGSSAREEQRREGQSRRKVRHRRNHACEGERSQNAWGLPRRRVRVRVQVRVRQGEGSQGREMRHHRRPLRLHAHAMRACCRQGRGGEGLQLKRRRAPKVWVHQISPSGKDQKQRRRVLACARHDDARLPLRAGVASRQQQRLPCNDVLAMLL